MNATKTINRLSAETITNLSSMFHQQIVPVLVTQLQSKSPEATQLALDAFIEQVLCDFHDLRNAELPEGVTPSTDLELFQAALARNGVTLGMKLKVGEKTPHLNGVVQTIEVTQKSFSWKKFGIAVGTTVAAVGVGYGFVRWNRNRKAANAAVATAAMMNV